MKEKMRVDGDRKKKGKGKMVSRERRKKDVLFGKKKKNERRVGWKKKKCPCFVRRKTISLGGKKGMADRRTKVVVIISGRGNCGLTRGKKEGPS